MKATVIFSIAVAVVITGAAPLAAIWALNTLFGVDIAVTWRTWLAGLILLGLISPYYNR